MDPNKAEMLAKLREIVSRAKKQKAPIARRERKLAGKRVNRQLGLKRHPEPER